MGSIEVECGEVVNLMELDRSRMGCGVRRLRWVMIDIGYKIQQLLLNPTFQPRPCRCIAPLKYPWKNGNAVFDVCSVRTAGVHKNLKHESHKASNDAR